MGYSAMYTTVCFLLLWNAAAPQLLAAGCKQTRLSQTLRDEVGMLASNAHWVQMQ